MKYGANSGLMMLRKKDGIIIDSTSNYFKKIVKTSDDDFTWKLLLFLKEPHEINEISSYMNLPLYETEEIVNKLLSEKLIVENPLTEKDKFFRVDRFVNSLPNITYLEYEKAVKKINIMILGVGTAGSYAIELLSKLGFINFVIIDSDTVEYKNLVSQNYSKNDIGMLKVKVLKEKYSDCNIIAINKKIHNYKEINKLLDKYNPQYFLSNADDVDLVLDILAHIFKDHQNIKILESGYNISEIQFELIDKNNYKFFAEKFREMRNYFMTGNDFNGIVDNSGMIFQSFISAFFSAKYIFDDVTNLADPDWGRFNLLEDKYFFDNRFYWSDFQKYMFRYREDNNEDFNKDTRNIVRKKPELDYKAKLFLATKSRNDAAFTFLKNLNLPEVSNKNEISIELLKELLVDYSGTIFDAKVIDYKYIINNNIVLFPNNSTSVKRNYSERANYFENRIYINSSGYGKYVNFIHETFHTLLFNITNDVYTHEEFVLNNMLNFCLYLNKSNEKLFTYLANSIINYVQGYYLDDYIIVNKEKSDLLNESTAFFNSLDYSSMNLRNKKELKNFINNKTKGKTKFYYLRYTQPVENNLQLIEDIVKRIKSNK